jgi:hypothetical protein
MSRAPDDKAPDVVSEYPTSATSEEAAEVASAGRDAGDGERRPASDGGAEDGRDLVASPSLRAVQAHLRELHADYRPAADWQARVLAAVRQPAPASSWLRRWWPALPACALAAAAVLLLVWRRPVEPPRYQLALAVSRAGEPTRGAQLHLGDRMTWSARGGATHRALWIFRGRDELVLACPPAPGCHRGDAELSVALVPARVGAYTAVALWSSEPLPVPSGGLDDALAKAARLGAMVRKQAFLIE